MVKCNKCHGTGFTTMVNGKHECGMCDGTGEIE